MNKKEYLVSLQRLVFEKPNAVLLSEIEKYNPNIKSNDISDALYNDDNNILLLSYNDICYPILLKLIVKPPHAISIKGDLGFIKKPMISIVGARKASKRAKLIAYRISADLARDGYVIVSGLAYGVDAAAHRGALSVGGVTVAVIGSGLDVDYPSRHHLLKKEILEKGAILSEFPIGTPPLSFNFPRRNRIIGGLSIATIIIEAARKSGSLITARFALEEGREVFVVQGPDNTVFCEGSNDLINDGAKAIRNASDVTSCINEIYYNNSGHEALYKNKERSNINLCDLASLAGVDLVSTIKWFYQKTKNSGG